MKRLFRLAVRVRYWKRRALSAEKTCIDLVEQFAAEKSALEAQCDAEFYRNRNREDVFVSAAVLGGRGMVGIAPRSGPATTTQPTLVQPADDPLYGLTGIERVEWYGQWLPDAQAHGVTTTKALQDFRAELAQRKQYRDEPIG